MEIEGFLSKLKKQDFYKNQIAYKTVISARSAIFGDLDFQLEPELNNWLVDNNFQLYSHQAKALNLINAGKNVVITTPTASGKTLIFSLAVANAIAKRRSFTSLFLYPTKALANDQLKKLEELNNVLKGKLRPFIYDGDTPSEQRPAIRNLAHCIISNPYALHQYLDWHNKWDRFYRNLRFIILDEAHIYRGVFGSNVAQLIRRLSRITSYYGALPQFILSSATINNPKVFSEKLIGKSVEVVEDNGSEHGEKHIILWNPPYLDRFQLKKRSPHQETRDLFVFHINQDFQTLCFTLSRRMAELISLWSSDDLRKLELDPTQVMAYRAGYLPQERRNIETRLRNHEIQGVVSTNALELGIDIGSLDAVILSGFPGTIISTWQQIGRVGRTIDPSLATIVLFEDAYQQFLGKNPSYLLERNPENAIIDLNNPYILKGHILCAAKELPLTLNELTALWGNQGKIIAKELLKEKLIKLVPSGIICSSKKRPASIVSLNSAFTDNFEVISFKKLLETITIPQLYREAHEGAILIHQGEKYFIEKVDMVRKKAIATPLDVDYYTESRSTSEIEIIECLNRKDLGFFLSYGTVEVTEDYHSYRIRTYDEVLEIKPLNLPPLKFKTKSLWFDIPSDVVTTILSRNLDFSGGIHALEHATIALSPLYAMCDRWDIGGISYPVFPLDGEARVFIYDGFPGGIGIAEQLFNECQELLINVLELIKSCECIEGCPSCIQSPKCGNDNYPLNKQVAILLLESLLEKSQIQLS